MEEYSDDEIINSLKEIDYFSTLEVKNQENEEEEIKHGKVEKFSLGNKKRKSGLDFKEELDFKIKAKGANLS